MDGKLNRDVSGCQRCVSECLNLSQSCHQSVTNMSRFVTEMSRHRLVTNLSPDVTEMSRPVTAVTHAKISHHTRHGRGVLFCVTAQTINVITRRHVSRYSFKLHKPSIRSRLCSNSSLLSVFVVAGKTHNVDTLMSCRRGVTRFTRLSPR